MPRADMQVTTCLYQVLLAKPLHGVAANTHPPRDQSANPVPPRRHRLHHCLSAPSLRPVLAMIRHPRYFGCWWYPPHPSNCLATPVLGGSRVCYHRRTQGYLPSRKSLAMVCGVIGNDTARQLLKFVLKVEQPRAQRVG